MPRIPAAIIRAMVAHAREDLPNEACGVIHAHDGVPVEAHRVRNVATFDAYRATPAEWQLFKQRSGWSDWASPWRYSMDAQALFKLERLRDESREELFAIYHSHVRSEAAPSPTDIRDAFWPPGAFEKDPLADPMYPSAYYILVSLKNAEPVVRAFHIRRGGAVEEEAIEIVD